jgi:hypothetical protein
VDSKLASGVMLTDRYRVDKELPLADGSTAFLATDTTTNDEVLAFQVDADSATVLRKAVGVSHPHLAAVREALIADFGHVLIVDYVPGSTADLFADGAPRLTRVDAVRFTLRLLDALLTLHNAGAAHGSLRPASVVIEPLSERPCPVLSHAPPAAGPYQRPERGPGPASPEDDVWAAAALLYRLVTGKDPAPTGVPSDAELKALGVDDSILPSALQHALSPDAASRMVDLKSLRRELARWLTEHAGEDVSHGSVSGGKPPPLPAGGPPVSVPTPSGAPAALTRSVPAKPAPPRRLKVAGLAIGAVALGLGAAYLAFALRPAPKPTPAASAASEVAPLPAASSFSLGEVAVTGEETESAMSGDKLGSCVAAHLPKASFKKAPDFAWLCTEKDPRIGAERLRTAVVQGAAGGAPTDAMRSFSQLGWYDMPTFAVLRTGCCSDAPALELPEPAKGCDAMAAALTDLGKAVIAGQNFDDALKKYGDVARCEATAKRSILFRKQGPPLPTEETAFRELVKHVRER